MSEQVLRVIGDVPPQPSAPTTVAVIEASPFVELRDGGRVIARLARQGNGEWLITIFITGLAFEGFYVTNRNEGVDALRDLGTLYHAAKTGALS